METMFKDLMDLKNRFSAIETAEKNGNETVLNCHPIFLEGRRLGKGETMASVESDIFEIIAEKAAVEREKVVSGAKLEELEIESLDVVEIIFAVEEKFDIHVPFNANDQELEFETVGDVVKAVEALIEETSGAAN